MGKDKKIKESQKDNNYIYYDPDLPESPKLEIYKETFGGLENVTKKWYKENGDN